ncbi:MAG: EamA family transporter [Lachnospiraceae bacterium]|nr:EamA family transporter [Lachnospiraceae bacterium]
MLVSALSLAVGQLTWKLADIGNLGDRLKSMEGIIALALAVAPGFIIYAVGAVIMTIALGYGELSILQPMNSMSYVFALVLSSIFLTESITPLMVAGVIVIITGVILIGGSSE